MEQSLNKLVYVFDKECKKSLTLYEGSIWEVDKFTTQFSNSKEIRKYFKKEIDEFNEQNKTYIKEIEKQTGRKETGDIVIAAYKDDNETFDRRILVIYKNYKKLMREISKNHKFISHISRRNYIKRNKNPNILRVFSDSQKKLSFPEDISKTRYQLLLNDWLKTFNDENGLIIARCIIEYYKKLYISSKELFELEDINAMYNRIKPKKLCESPINKKTKVSFEIKSDEYNKYEEQISEYGDNPIEEDYIYTTIDVQEDDEYSDAYNKYGEPISEFGNNSDTFINNYDENPIENVENQNKSSEESFQKTFRKPRREIY